MGRVRGALVLGVGFVVMSLPAVASATTGPYTLPFYTPTGVNQGYGCTSFSSEKPWSTGQNADGTTYTCNAPTDWFHTGIDFDTETRSVAAARAGTVKAVYNAQCCSTYPTISTGNYVIIKYDSTHWSMYYHLKQNSIAVSLDDEVSAGQLIGISGNTGNSTGPHLHYVLMNCKCPSPSPGQTYAPNGKWTTSTGRVPWLNSTLSESATGDICSGSTITKWVKFKNTGGQTWKTTNDANGHSRVIIHATDSGGSAFVNSAFAATDWESASTPGVADEATVTPDGTGTFTFGLKGNGTQGSYYTLYFNLNAEDLRNFLYSETDYQFTIFIVPHQACIP
jgi:murein DD-endopeptidase MepM/ murein hydrolase activator NlpD